MRYFQGQEHGPANARERAGQRQEWHGHGPPGPKTDLPARQNDQLARQAGPVARQTGSVERQGTELELLWRGRILKTPRIAMSDAVFLTQF